MPQAAGLAAAIKDDFGIDCQMIPGGGGIFDVKVNGDLIYSKHQTGRFPQHHEVLDKIAPKVR
jgi:selenoprotein W-related protein